MSELASNLPARHYVTYHLDPKGFHVLTFHESSKRAVDQWFEHAQRIMREGEKEPVIRVMYDTRPSGTLPLLYLSEKAKELMNLFPDHPQFRLAMVYNDQLFIRLVDKFLDLIVNRQQDRTRFFKASQYEEAVAWLTIPLPVIQAKQTGEYKLPTA